MDFDIEKVSTFVREKFAHVSAETLGWLAVIAVHAATMADVPGLACQIQDKGQPKSSRARRRRRSPAIRPNPSPAIRLR